MAIWLHWGWAELGQQGGRQGTETDQAVQGHHQGGRSEEQKHEAPRRAFYFLPTYPQPKESKYLHHLIQKPKNISIFNTKFPLIQPRKLREIKGLT